MQRPRTGLFLSRKVLFQLMVVTTPFEVLNLAHWHGTETMPPNDCSGSHFGLQAVPL